MAKFCTRCGRELSDAALFCTECGQTLEQECAEPALTEAAPSEDADNERMAAERADTSPAEVRPQAAQDDAKSAAEKTPTTAMAFLGMLMLFPVPVIGWAACLVTCFAARKQSYRSFARAYAVWALIAVLALAVCAAVLVIFAEPIREYADRVLTLRPKDGGAFDLLEFTDRLAEALEEKNMDINGLIDRLKAVL